MQTDAFGGYDGLYAHTGEPGNDRVVLEVACWAHARRNFHEARARALRQEHAQPLLDTIQAWLEDQAEQVLPKSPIGEPWVAKRNPRLWYVSPSGKEAD